MKEQLDMLFSNYGNEIVLVCSVIFLAYILRDIVLALKERQSGSDENSVPASHILLFDFLFLLYLLHMINTLIARIW